MIAVDTNVIVRIVTHDDPDQTRRAVALFERERIFITKTVLWNPRLSPTPPVPVGFVGDLAAQLAHADIGDCARQVMIRYWFSLIVLQAFDFKLDRRDEPHLNSQ